MQFLIQTSSNFYSELTKEGNSVSSKTKGSKPLFAKNFIVFIGYLINKYSAEQILNDFNAIA